MLFSREFLKRVCAPINKTMCWECWMLHRAASDTVNDQILPSAPSELSISSIPPLLPLHRCATVSQPSLIMSLALSSGYMAFPVITMLMTHIFSTRWLCCLITHFWFLRCIFNSIFARENFKFRSQTRGLWRPKQETEIKCRHKCSSIWILMLYNSDCAEYINRQMFATTHIHKMSRMCIFSLTSELYTKCMFTEKTDTEEGDQTRPSNSNISLTLLCNSKLPWRDIQLAWLTERTENTAPS